MKTMSEYEADIVALADRLRAVPIGGIVSYAELDKTLGRPVRHHRYLLVSARERVEREDGALFASIFNHGIKRMPIEAYATVGQKSRASIRKKARSASKRMANGLAKANDAPPDVVRAVSREQSVLGLIQYAAKDSTLKKMLEDEPITAPTPLAHAAKDLMRALGIKVPE